VVVKNKKQWPRKKKRCFSKKKRWLKLLFGFLTRGFVDWLVAIVAAFARQSKTRIRIARR
jgi:hypothetical protein